MTCISDVTAVRLVSLDVQLWFNNTPVYTCILSSVIYAIINIVIKTLLLPTEVQIETIALHDGVLTIKRNLCVYFIGYIAEIIFI